MATPMKNHDDRISELPHFVELTLFLLFLALVASSISALGQPVANDDFYIIDRYHDLPTYENDDSPGGQLVFTRVPDSSLGHVGVANWGGCTTCPWANPSGSATGADFFQYKYIPVGVPGPESNIATVGLIFIGNSEQQNAGRSCSIPGWPKSFVGEPVNVTNWNMWHEQADYSLPGRGEAIQITRFYNSINQWGGPFGFGWTTQHDNVQV